MATRTQKPRYRISPEEAKYFKLWKIYCRRFGLKTSDSESRHNVHTDALGYERSHKEFSHTEYDIVYAFMIAQINEQEFDRDEYIGAADGGERKRKIYRILQEAPWGYVHAIAKSRFAANDWQNLPLKDLEQLRITIVERSRSFKRKHGVKATLYDNIKPVETREEDPF